MQEDLQMKSSQECLPLLALSSMQHVLRHLVVF